MSKYKVEKEFENFAIGDQLDLNPRQAKYRLLSGHITPAEAALAEAEQPVDETVLTEAEQHAFDSALADHAAETQEEHA